MAQSVNNLSEETGQTPTMNFKDPFQLHRFPLTQSSHSLPTQSKCVEEIIIEPSGLRMLIIKILSGVKDRIAILPLQLMDINCLAFLMIVSTTLLFFHHSVPDWKTHYLHHMLFASAILLIIGIIGKLKPNRFWMALRFLYPVAIISFAWNELTDLVPMIYGNYWATEFILAWDKFLFGVHPTIWFQNWYNLWSDEVMNVCYSGYYLYMPLILLGLFIKKRFEDLSQVLSIVTWTFLGNFILYYLIPVLGPQMIPDLQSLSYRENSGFIIAHVTRLVQSNGGIVGGAFPSSHVAGGVIWTLVGLRYFRKVGIFMLPLTLGMVVSTVYLGYHHGIDALAGLSWGILNYILVSKWNRKFPNLVYTKKIFISPDRSSHKYIEN